MGCDYYPSVYVATKSVNFHNVSVKVPATYGGQEIFDKQGKPVMTVSYKQVFDLMLGDTLLIKECDDDLMQEYVEKDFNVIDGEEIVTLSPYSDRFEIVEYADTLSLDKLQQHITNIKQFYLRSFNLEIQDSDICIGVHLSC